MKAAFIGLGAMGTHMAANLAAKGLLSAVHDLDDAAARAASDRLKVPAVADPAALWRDSDAVVLCVSNDAAVREVVRALAVPAARGKCVIDCSTVSPETATEAAERLAAVGAQFIDAPINGGTDGARTAKLIFILGGAPEACEAMRPLFEAMGQRQIRIGDTGSGQATKAVNQALTAGIAQAVTEGLAFADALGLPMPLVIETLSTGAAGAWFAQNQTRREIGREFPPGLKIDLHHKDLTICQQLVAQIGGQLPTVDTTLAQYQTLMAQGYGEEDISALYRLNRKLFS
ncbi:MAG TPA: NAD(P)-dependent oxidoreductase [Solimonas sp.]